jgi:multicomponent Na+:H+ antiporter subunit E
MHSGGSTLRALSLGVVLFAFWLLLSGYFVPFLVTMGAVAAIAVAMLGRRMDVIDHEGHPVHLAWRVLWYWPWLFKEIAKSAWDVARIIVHPGLPISPTLVRAKTSQKTAVGVTTYANCITLTPGTISIDVKRDEILVHALTREGAEGLLAGEMDRRVTRFEGAP